RHGDRLPALRPGRPLHGVGRWPPVHRGERGGGLQRTRYQDPVDGSPSPPFIRSSSSSASRGPLPGLDRRSTTACAAETVTTSLDVSAVTIVLRRVRANTTSSKGRSSQTFAPASAGTRSSSLAASSGSST